MVPTLTRLARYRDLALLLARHGRRDLVAHMELDEAILAEDVPDAGGDPERLAADLEALGPTYIKLGQMLSTRSDLLPPTYLDALARLQDDIAPFSFAEVEEIVEQELGVRLSKAFETFEAEPVAAASLGQVHHATLRDGRPVAVKVQRPGIRAEIAEDLAALSEIADLADAHTEIGQRFGVGAMLAEFRSTLLRELDYRQEASHLDTLAGNLAGYDRIVVPRPVADYTTSRVLTLDWVPGVKVSALPPVARTELDGHALAVDLLKAYLDQILVDGFFHADPHPGNVFVTDDHRLALIDLGMVARLDPRMQEHLLRLLLHISEGRGRDAAEQAIGMGTPQPDFEREPLEKGIAELVARFQNASLTDLPVGRVVMEVARLQGLHGLRPPPELTMLGKTLLNLDEIGRVLDPGFDPNAVIREHSGSVMERRMRKDLTPGAVFAAALEAGEFAQKLPGRLNSLLEELVEHRFELRIRTFDEARMMAGFEKVANRIATGVVLAALIVGAALLMRVPTSFTILGYPGLAIVLFLLAAAFGFGLVVSIWRDDRRPPTP